MKNKLITLLKAIGIVLAICVIAQLLGILTRWNSYLHLFMVLAFAILGIRHFYRIMRPKKRYYFVSYSHDRGFGDCSIEAKGIFVRREASDLIRNSYFNIEDKVVILYYKELSKEEYYAQTKGDKE